MKKFGWLPKLVFAVLLAAWAAAPSGEVVASTCCYQCSQDWLVWCMNNCGSNTTCSYNCELSYYKCGRRCSGGCPV